MYQETIHQSLKACLENKATFPEHVKTIVSVGVTGYKVDLTQGEVTYYLANNKTHIKKIAIAKTDIDKPEFSADAIKEAIAKTREKAIDYPAFLTRIIKAGVKSYDVSIKEEKVTYRGEDKNYIEPFPKPKQP